MTHADGSRLRPMGLAARMILFLTLALVPIGVVAYFQTAKLQQETRLRSQLSLVALTEAAALGERETILRALGSAQALGATVGQALLETGDTEACGRRLATYLETSPGYSFVTVLTADGRLPCTSRGEELDIADFQHLSGLLEEPRSVAYLNREGPLSNRSVIVVGEPFFTDGELAGYMLLSVPSALLPRDEGRNAQSPQAPEDFRDIVFFNNRGEVLSSRAGLDDVADLLPADLELRSLIGGGAQSFAARSADGETRVYAAAPLVPGMVHALGVWNHDNAEAEAITVSNVAKALPLLMWAASVIVAFLAVNRLVIRHIKRLSRRMRTFARTRRIPEHRSTLVMPAELADMEDDFLDMADGILRDEAQQENALREKTILLKEVHHRVKNNLQLISSIMNMQIRQSRERETRFVLHRLQDRIRSLATIHRNLYQTEDLGHVNAGVLLTDLVQQMTQMIEISGRAVQVERDLADIEVVPDQAVPLSLLTAEALTNALKYGAAPDGDAQARVMVSFRHDGQGNAVLEIRNSAGPEGRTSDDEDLEVEPAGLGARLIQAFATQLGGRLEQGREDGEYVVHVHFQLTDFEPDETVPTEVPNVPDF
ncbi:MULTISPECIES: sensor histidine kinase [Salipiger]|jgi:two-component sensor histidine kinase|uniref:histidine kinase n=1 Tax=Salipiger profundus TaxID=1229727 RepID=A0A1U7DB18_9RHOB|nr:MULTISPECIES: sensor histidine kinase [Salipiger]APX25364.1 signal transduction histidine kinase [Salipiger profundus]GGA24935.1 histidine kinase [Salipiger profundus]SFD85552.1 Two-component sensor histidine kinase, contains HisKA and HATPase domains [Salipiger profundus]